MTKKEKTKGIKKRKAIGFAYKIRKCGNTSWW